MITRKNPVLKNEHGIFLFLDYNFKKILLKKVKQNWQKQSWYNQSAGIMQMGIKIFFSG